MTTTGPSPLVVAQMQERPQVSLVHSTAGVCAQIGEALERCGSRLHAEAETSLLLVDAEEEQVRTLVRNLMGRKTN